MLDAGMFAAVSLFPVALLVRPRVWVSAAFKRSQTMRGWIIRHQWCVSVFRYHKVVSFGGVFSSADAIAIALAGEWKTHSPAWLVVQTSRSRSISRWFSDVSLTIFTAIRITCATSTSSISGVAAVHSTAGSFRITGWSLSRSCRQVSKDAWTAPCSSFIHSCTCFILSGSVNGCGVFICLFGVSDAPPTANKTWEATAGKSIVEAASSLAVPPLDRSGLKIVVHRGQ